MRNDFTRFPQLNELLEIIAKEQQRKLPEEKQDTHYPDFSLIQKLLSLLKVDSQFFSKEHTYQDLISDDLPFQAQHLADEVVKKLSSATLSALHMSLLNDIYEYLSEEDVLEKSDIAFVFGSKSNARIIKAIEVMEKNFANYLLVSGNSPIYDIELKASEAERLSTFAVDNKVDRKKIIIENASISIPDNVRSSLNLLDDREITYKSFILVNSPYSQRRGWVHFKKYLSDSVRLIRLNSETVEKFSKEKWFTNEEGIRVIMNEFIKMKVAVILNTA